MRTRLFLATTGCLLTGWMMVFGALAAEAAGVTRVRNALLIGNAAYPDSDAALATPIGDVRLLAEELKRKGFAVEAGEDLTKERMQATVDRFLRKVEPGSVAFVFFGGYSIQVGRKNYLVPVDARIWSESDVLRDGIALDAIVADLDTRGSGARLVVLDASRRNPFERRFRSFSAGLAEIKAAPGLLALSSAAAGSVLADVRATTSPFVAELVKQIANPDLGAVQAFTATRDAVSRDTRSQQVPALVSGLDDGFAFDPNRVKSSAPPARAENKPAPQKADATKPTAPPADTASGDDDVDAMIKAEEETARDFNAVMAKGTKSALEGFLKRHPTGALPNVARTELARLDPSAKPAPPERPAPQPDMAMKPATPAAPPLPPVTSIEAEAPSTAASAPWRSPPKTYSMAELQRKASLDARINRNPRDATAFYERGQFHAQRDDYPSAIADFDQAIRLDPKSPEALNNRCWVRAISSELQKALSDCNAALKLRPGFIDALDSRGFVNLKSGSLQAAISDYDTALRFSPTHSSALYGRGIARSRLGQSAQANDDLTRALALNPMIDKDFAQYGLR